MHRKPLPDFKHEREIVKFFDDPKLDLSAYDLNHWGEPVRIEFSERARLEAELRRRGDLVPIGIRMSRPALRRIKELAAHKGVGYQPLIRMWIHERLSQELWHRDQQYARPTGRTARLKGKAKLHERLGDRVPGKPLSVAAKARSGGP